MSVDPYPSKRSDETREEYLSRCSIWWIRQSMKTEEDLRREAEEERRRISEKRLPWYVD